MDFDQYLEQRKAKRWPIRQSDGKYTVPETGARIDQKTAMQLTQIQIELNNGNRQ